MQTDQWNASTCIDEHICVNQGHAPSPHSALRVLRTHVVLSAKHLRINFSVL